MLYRNMILSIIQSKEEFNMVSKDENKNADNAKKQAYGRHTILIDIAKKAEENTKNAKIKMIIE